MQITEVRVFPVDEEKLKAYASIVLDACFIVNDLKVIEGKRGLFISMPSRRRKRGGYRDVAHPLNNETRRMIEEGVLAEYQRALGEAAAGVRLAPHDEDMPDDERWHEPAVEPPAGAVVGDPGGQRRRRRPPATARARRSRRSSRSTCATPSGA